MSVAKRRNLLLADSFVVLSMKADTSHRTVRRNDKGTGSLFKLHRHQIRTGILTSGLSPCQYPSHGMKDIFYYLKYFGDNEQRQVERITS